MISLLNTQQDLSISLLCKIAKVSKSGYYAWLHRELSDEDIKLGNLIKNIFWKEKGKFGYRRILMELKQIYQLNINGKKVLRIMKREGLKAVIRKKNNSNAHFFAQKKSENWTIAPNILNGNFKYDKSDTRYSTDVTYLYLKNGQRYFLSAIKDLATGEIVAHSISDKHNIELILDSLDKVRPKENSIIHSDRGVLYSSFRYIQKLREKGITRSMSESGKPTQNAPIESFFGHLKDKVEYKNCKDFKELKDKIDNYVYYYNTARFQWNKKMLTPCEVKEYLCAYNSCPF